MKRRPHTAAAAVGPRTRQKQRTRERLLASARRVLERRGFAKTTSREIAAEAGVASGTFFVHFPDVDALVEALLEEHLVAALGDAVRTLPRRSEPIDRLLHVSRALFDSYDAEPELAREYVAASLFRSRSGGPTEARLREFAAWVSEQLAEVSAAAKLEPGQGFGIFFWLYFGALVQGLRGELNRTEQLAFLESSLRRLLRMEKPS